jgi:hypothetical protein
LPLKAVATFASEIRTENKKPKTNKLIMKITKTLMMLSALIFASSVLSSCKKEEGCTDPNATNYNPDAKKDDNSCTYAQVEGTVTKSGILSGNETWTADKIYFLEGRVVVPDGVTLTINPGTIIKGKQGQETNASALVVARGGILLAEGTAADPIIFTTELDNIQVGQKVGTNLSRTDNEKWGGVAILGKAPISAQDGDTETNLEGIPAEALYGLYGGNNPSDYSGKLRFVSIRHGGISIGEGNELNGLTMGGVGNATIVENIEIYATLDDGIECFGGTVNVTNSLVYYQGDDGIDLDMNYSGTFENFIVIHGDGIGTDKGLEIDGPEGSTYTTGKFTLRNGLVMSEGQDGTASDFKDKAQGTVENVTFDYSSQGGSVQRIRARYDAANSCAPQADALVRLLAGDLVFTAISAPNVNLQVYTSVAACESELPAGQAAGQAFYSTNGAGGNVSAGSFSWTCTALRGQLNF